MRQLNNRYSDIKLLGLSHMLRRGAARANLPYKFWFLRQIANYSGTFPVRTVLSQSSPIFIFLSFVQCCG